MGRLSQALWVFDIDRYRVVWANPAALEIWRAESLDELRSRDMGEGMYESVATRLRQYQSDFEKYDARFSESWTLFPKGIPVALQVVLSGVRLEDGRMAMLCESQGVLQAAPETLRSAEALLYTSVLITLYARDGEALYRNPAAREKVAAVTERFADHFVESQDYDRLAYALQTEGQGRLAALVHTAHGHAWHDISAKLCSDGVTGDEAVLVSEVDISELKQTEARAHYLANHDTLTGLPNRNFVLNAFQLRLEQVKQLGNEAALIFIDLDRFKNVNDSLGHAAGDQLLVQMAQRLAGVVRESDMVARLGGDEFLVLTSASAIAPYARVLCQRILAAMSAGMVVEGTEVQVTPSLGICLFPQDGQNMDTLMKNADIAMYRAKAEGRNRIAFFTPELATQAQNRLALESEIRLGMERGEFEVYYQPRIDVRQGEIVAAEALLRWHHPERGCVMPDVFIPICEECGLIQELGRLVLRDAIRQQRQWQTMGSEIRVSVNLSPNQFNNPDLLVDIRDILRETSGNASLLELEITESVLMGPDDHAVHTLGALRDMGFLIAIDDFGTGYSNLAYLQRYPINSLKIDRSFVKEVAQSPAITQTIITLCRLLELHVVAEGVETQDQKSWLLDQGCREAQGFLYSPAVPAQAFQKLLDQGFSAHP